MNMPNLRALIAQANESVRKTGWHIWLSSEGRLWATRSRSRAEMIRLGAQYGGLWIGSGETITAESLGQMLAKIKRRTA